MLKHDKKSDQLDSVPFPMLASSPKGLVECDSAQVLTEKREHPRLEFKVPVLIRDATGAQDASMTEDVSKSGFSFTSDRFYIAGEVVSVSIRCGFGIAAFQTQVRVVRKADLGIPGRQLYGVCYLHSDDTLAVTQQ